MFWAIFEELLRHKNIEIDFFDSSLLSTNNKKNRHGVGNGKNCVSNFNSHSNTDGQNEFDFKYEKSLEGDLAPLSKKKAVESRKESHKVK